MKNACVKCILSIGAPFPLCQKVDTDIIQVMKATRPPPSVFAHCNQSKSGWWEGLGMRLMHSSLFIIT